MEAIDAIRPEIRPTEIFAGRRCRTRISKFFVVTSLSKSDDFRKGSQEKRLGGRNSRPCIYDEGYLSSAIVVSEEDVPSA